MHDTGERDGIERSEYLVEQFRVSFESGSVWHCPCHEFAHAGGCRHTREAAGMRAAQTVIARHNRGDGSRNKWSL